MHAVVEQQPRKKYELPPAQILDCTPEEYKQDPCEAPSLSATTAHTLVSKSPMHAWAAHPKFGSQEDDEEEDEAEEDDSDAKDNGTIIHNLLLGKGTDFVVLDFNDFRKKVAKQARDEARAAGKVPILTKRHDTLVTAADILRARCREYGYEFNGQSEIPIQWYEYGQHGPVLCRSMIDHGFLDQGVSFDVKTIRNANPEHINRTFVEHGYHIQDRAYTRSQEQLYPELTGRIDLTFLFMEIKPPYAVVPFQPDGAQMECGRLHWERAVRIWETCLATSQWPSYCTGRIVGEMPEWQQRRYLGSEWVAK